MCEIYSSFAALHSLDNRTSSCITIMFRVNYAEDGVGGGWNMVANPNFNPSLENCSEPHNHVVVCSCA